jgi:hypothetical protein
VIRKAVTPFLLLLFLFSIFLTACSDYTRVESAGFDQQLDRWCPEITSYTLKQKDGTLFAKLVANEDLDARTVNQSMTWILLFLVKYKEQQYSDLVNRGILDKNHEGPRFSAIDVTIYLKKDKIIEWNIDESKFGDHVNRPIVAREYTEIPLRSKVLEYHSIKEFRKRVLEEYAAIADVVVEKMLLNPLGRTVKFVSKRPFELQIMEETKGLVVSELLKEPVLAQEQNCLILVEYYVNRNLTHQFAWDNWAEEWIRGDWREHVFTNNSEEIP